MKITERFAALDENLKLDPDQRRCAQDLHNEISGHLIEAGIASRCRLQGSFARKTMLPPLHDVDKVVELKEGLRDEFSGSNGPQKAMDQIQAVLGPHFPGASFTPKKHSLGIWLPEHEFDFDAVPAFVSVDKSNWVDIANTKAGQDEDLWKPSNTYELIEVVATRNGACNGKFVRQVRMVKQIVANAGLSEVLPGLHSESFAYEAITEDLPHAEAVAAALRKASELMGGTYTDPTGVDEISARLEPWKVDAVGPQLAALASQADQALALAADGQEIAAARIWAGLFGDSFPAPTAEDVAEDDERRLMARLYTGGTLAATNRPAPSSRAWRP